MPDVCCQFPSRWLSQLCFLQEPETKVKSVRPSDVNAPTKAPSDITGIDKITGGCLPCGRTTLLMGGRGSGTTILALHFLAHGGRGRGSNGLASAVPARIGIENALVEIKRGRATAYYADSADACLRLFREGRYQLPSP